MISTYKLDESPIAKFKHGKHHLLASKSFLWIEIVAMDEVDSENVALLSRSMA
jgi:hypothetical protein